MSGPQLVCNDLQERLRAVDRTSPERISRLVEIILDEAVRRQASDVHIEPTVSEILIRFRLDGVLHTVAGLPPEQLANLIARLKVLAELLTYRIDIPQEGRIAQAVARHGVDMRVGIFPTIHGERAVIRLFDRAGSTIGLEQLGLPAFILQPLLGMLRERSGAILLTGPSGSGKTTTIYACLRQIVQQTQGGCHLVSIEDPVEQVLQGVSQSQARPGTEFDFARGLRGLLRQDPEVIMIGEIRDPETASIAIEAALTGHFVFSTVHAGSACGVIARLLEMGIEPYLATSALKGILNQRLLRRSCPSCRASGCDACGNTGYRGRLLLAELLTIDAPLRRAILARNDTTTLQAVATSSQGVSGRTIRDSALQAVEAGWTTSAEVERVLGPSTHRAE